MSRQLSTLKIYLLDRNPEMYGAWNEHFFGVDNVEVVCSDFIGFMRQNKGKVDGIVSPANGYGLMDGGYDQAITDWFGDTLQQKVRQYIIDNLYGEQPLCSSIVIDTDMDGIKLIHTPTMRFPGIIKDSAVVYHCMRTCLMAALGAGIHAVVVPAFGGSAGCVSEQEVARMMWRAYAQLSDPPTKIDWTYAKDQRI